MASASHKPGHPGIAISIGRPYEAANAHLHSLVPSIYAHLYCTTAPNLDFARTSESLLKR
jgi:hypothetical protein